LKKEPRRALVEHAERRAHRDPIQRPGRIKNATRDILPPRLATIAVDGKQLTLGLTMANQPAIDPAVGRDDCTPRASWLRAARAQRKPEIAAAPCDPQGAAREARATRRLAPCRHLETAARFGKHESLARRVLPSTAVEQ
jgi:hypothetical protein